MRRLITNKSVVHHAAMPQNMEKEQAMRQILAAHKAAGLADDGYIAYHRVIGYNWTAQGRPDNLVGYHCGNWATNQTSIAVCLMGNFQNDTPNEYQKTQLKNILQEWMKTYGIKRENIKLHRQIKATACPGRNIDLPLIYDLLDTPAIITDQDIQILFKSCWNGITPATGDWSMFKKEYKLGLIKNIGEMKSEMTYWYGIVYPKGVYSKSGNEKWQRKKNKVAVL